MTNEEVLQRAAELLEATALFIEVNPISDYGVHYDEADCDGGCLQEECGTWARIIREHLAALKAQPSFATLERADWGGIAKAAVAEREKRLLAEANPETPEQRAQKGPQ